MSEKEKSNGRTYFIGFANKEEGTEMILTEKELLCLSLFGHGKEIVFGEFIGLGFFSKHRILEWEAKVILKKFLSNNWIHRLHESNVWDGDWYMLTEKGDRLFREEQIARGGDYRFYRYAERNPQSFSKWGSEKKVFEIDSMMKRLNLNKPIERKVYDAMRRQKDRILAYMEKFKI